MHINTRGLVAFLSDTILRKDSNVIEIAKFLKSFNDFSYKIGHFIHGLKNNFELRILDMSADKLQEMRTIGKLIAELKNLAVTNNDSKNLWLEKVKTLDPVENFEVMEVYIDVLKPMLVDIQVYEFNKLKEIHKYILEINNSLEQLLDTEDKTRIKAKVDQILENIVIKQIDPVASDILFKAKYGYKVDGLSIDMPEKSPKIFDVQDFAKIFYKNAISNHLFTQNYANSIPALKTGPRGTAFIHALKDTLPSNLIQNLFTPEFCESDEALGTFDFIVQLFYEDIVLESVIIAILNNILDLKNLEYYKNYASRFLENLQSISHGTSNNKRFSPNLRSCIAKVQNKLKKLDVENVKVKNLVENTEVLCKEVKNVEVDSWEDLDD
jgi:hypothetical protein